MRRPEVKLHTRWRPSSWPRAPCRSSGSHPGECFQRCEVLRHEPSPAGDEEVRHPGVMSWWQYSPPKTGGERQGIRVMSCDRKTFLRLKVCWHRTQERGDGAWVRVDEPVSSLSRVRMIYREDETKQEDGEGDR